MYCIDCGTQNLDPTRYCSRLRSELEVSHGSERSR